MDILICLWLSARGEPRTGYGLLLVYRILEQNSRVSTKLLFVWVKKAVLLGPLKSARRHAQITRFCHNKQTKDSFHWGKFYCDTRTAVISKFSFGLHKDNCICTSKYSPARWSRYHSPEPFEQLWCKVLLSHCTCQTTLEMMSQASTVRLPLIPQAHSVPGHCIWYQRWKRTVMTWLKVGVIE